MAGTQLYNTDLDVLGNIKVANVPNATGTLLTYNATTKLISTRTNTQILSDLGLTTVVSNSHTHTNKSVLDGITSTKVSNWDSARAYSQIEHLPLAGGNMRNNSNVLFGNQTANGSSLFGTTAAELDTGYGIWLGQNLSISTSGKFIQPRGNFPSLGFTVNHHRGFSFNSVAANGTYGAEVTLTEVAKISRTGLISGSGFSKSGSNNNYVLLGDGGHKAIGDFILTSHPSNTITSTNISNWNTAFSWGNFRDYGLGSNISTNYGSWNLTTGHTSFLASNDHASNLAPSASTLFGFKQIYGGTFGGEIGYRNNRIGFRTLEANILGPWNEIWHSGNFNPDNLNSIFTQTSQNGIKTNIWNSSANSPFAVAIGNLTNVTGTGSIGIGYSLTANGIGSIISGMSSSLNGNFSSSIGSYNSVKGDYISALGTGITATQPGITVIGRFNEPTSNYNYDDVDPSALTKKEVLVLAAGDSITSRKNILTTYANDRTRVRNGLFYDPAFRNTIDWTDTTLVDKKWVLDNVSGGGGGDFMTKNTNNVITSNFSMTNNLTKFTFNDYIFSIQRTFNRYINISITEGIELYRDGVNAGFDLDYIFFNNVTVTADNTQTSNLKFPTVGATKRDLAVGAILNGQTYYASNNGLIDLGNGGGGGSSNGFMSNHVVDMTSYNQDQWFAVIIPLYSTKETLRIRVDAALNEGNSVPTWASNSGGFSLDFEVETIGSGWGETHMTTRVIRDNARWIVDESDETKPCGYKQDFQTGDNILWLRGGGKYNIRTDKSTTTPIIYTSGMNGLTSLNPLNQRVLSVDENIVKHGILSNNIRTHDYGNAKQWGDIILKNLTDVNIPIGNTLQILRTETTTQAGRYSPILHLGGNDVGWQLQSIFNGSTTGQIKYRSIFGTNYGAWKRILTEDDIVGGGGSNAVLNRHESNLMNDMFNGIIDLDSDTRNGIFDDILGEFYVSVKRPSDNAYIKPNYNNSYGYYGVSYADSNYVSHGTIKLTDSYGRYYKSLGDRFNLILTIDNTNHTTLTFHNTSDVMDIRNTSSIDGTICVYIGTITRSADQQYIYLNVNIQFL